MRLLHLPALIPAFLLPGCYVPSAETEARVASELVQSLQHELRPEVREAFATTPDGVRLYYRVAGEGDQVVIAPFALYHGDALDPLARGRRIVTYDPRGRGRSAAVPPERVSQELLLSDLDTIRRAVGAERVALIGWSGGGAETFAYALRNPGRVSRIVQLAPVAARFSPYGQQMMADREARMDKAEADALRARIRAGEFAGKPELECRERNRVTGPALLADPADHALVPDVCVYPNEHPATIGAYFDALFKSIEGSDWRPDLPKVSIPRLIIYPMQDNIPRAGVEEWVRGQPNARILYVEQSGHHPLREQPEITLNAIARFLAGEWPPAAVALP